MGKVERGCMVKVSSKLLLELLGLGGWDVRVSYATSMNEKDAVVFYLIGDDSRLPKLKEDKDGRYPLANIEVARQYVTEIKLVENPTQ